MKKYINKKENGFTLIELMVTVAIIGLLAAIAFPSYKNSLRKAQHTDARNSLVSILGLQTRYLTTNNTYTTTLSDLGLTPISGVYLSDDEYFAITAAVCTTVPAPPLTECVMLTAAPTTKAVDGVETEITANSIGQRTPASIW